MRRGEGEEGRGEEGRGEEKGMKGEGDGGSAEFTCMLHTTIQFPFPFLYTC